MTTTTPRVSITVDRVQDMDDREMYNVTDCYVKNRLSRFAVDPEAQVALQQRELPKASRDVTLSETAETFEAVKKQVYEILYAPTVLPRHHHALTKMRDSVQAQLSQNEDVEADWRRSAQSFLDLVKDELARAEVVLQQQEEESARRHLALLLDAVQEHREAEDADQADENLYAVADQIAESIFNQASKSLASA